MAFLLCIWLLFIYAAFYLMLGASRWIATMRAFGWPTRKLRLTMNRLTLVGQSRETVAGGGILLLVLAALSVSAYLVFHEWRLLSGLALAISVRGWLAIRTGAPPLVLYLSTSDRRSAEFHHTIQKCSHPLRAVSLLDSEPHLKSSQQSEIHLDRFRTLNNDDWWLVITMFSESCGIVVVNGMVSTDGVVRECRHLLDSDLRYKTIVLSGLPDTCPLLERLGEPATNLCLATNEQALIMIEHARSLREVPSATWTTCQLQEQIRAR